MPGERSTQLRSIRSHHSFDRIHTQSVLRLHLLLDVPRRGASLTQILGQGFCLLVLLPLQWLLRQQVACGSEGVHEILGGVGREALEFGKEVVLILLQNEATFGEEGL